MVSWSDKLDECAIIMSHNCLLARCDPHRAFVLGHRTSSMRELRPAHMDKSMRATRTPSASIKPSKIVGAATPLDTRSSTQSMPTLV